jgi:ABC-type bacteriocin/lantibiotic exporter with double-glycine peptidase domain
MSRLRRILLTLAASSALVTTTGVAAVWAYPSSLPVARTIVWLLGAEYLGRDGVTIQQSEDDCGIAALQMIMEGRGIPGAVLDSARAEVIRRGEGTSFWELKQLAEAQGIRADGWRMGAQRLARSPLPAIVDLTDHFTVVERVLPDGRVELRDPSLGRIRMSAEDFHDNWTGNVLIFPAGSSSRTPPSVPASR